MSRPKQASTAQKRRMEKTLEKSAMKALTWRQDGETGVETVLNGRRGPSVGGGVISGVERVNNGIERVLNGVEE